MNITDGQLSQLKEEYLNSRQRPPRRIEDILNINYTPSRSEYAPIIDKVIRISTKNL